MTISSSPFARYAYKSITSWEANGKVKKEETEEQFHPWLEKKHTNQSQNPSLDWKNVKLAKLEKGNKCFKESNLDQSKGIQYLKDKAPSIRFTRLLWCSSSLPSVGSARNRAPLLHQFLQAESEPTTSSAEPLCFTSLCKQNPNQQLFLPFTMIPIGVENTIRSTYGLHVEHFYNTKVLCILIQQWVNGGTSVKIGPVALHRGSLYKTSRGFSEILALVRG